MNIVGKWKISEAMVLNKDLTRTWRSASDILADDTLDDDVKQSVGFGYVFTDDGKALTIFLIPEDMPKEELDEALSSGEASLYDDSTLVLEEKAWKEEDGKLLYDTGMKGEVLGEAVSPWTEIIPTADGIEMLSFRLVRA